MAFVKIDQSDIRVVPLLLPSQIIRIIGVNVGFLFHVERIVAACYPWFHCHNCWMSIFSWDIIATISLCICNSDCWSIIL